MRLLETKTDNEEMPVIKNITAVRLKHSRKQKNSVGFGFVTSRTKAVQFSDGFQFDTWTANSVTLCLDAFLFVTSHTDGVQFVISNSDGILFVTLSLDGVQYFT